MKKIYALVAVLVLLLGASFVYIIFFQPDEKQLTIEIGKDKTYDINLSSYDEYYNILMQHSIVYVKGKVSSVEKTSTSAIITLCDESTDAKLDVYTNGLVQLEKGDTAYVYGAIQSYNYDGSNPFYYINVRSEAIVESFISSESDGNEYITVGDALKQAHMIYEQVFFEVEGDIEVLPTELDGDYYYLIDGTESIRLIRAKNQNLTNGEHVVIVGTASENVDLLVVENIKERQ